MLALARASGTQRDAEGAGSAMIEDAVESPPTRAPREEPRHLVLAALGVRLRFVALLALLVAAAALWNPVSDRVARAAHGHSAPESATAAYVCPMHPEVVRDAPAKCPTCGMPLSRRESAQSATPQGELRLAPQQVAQAGIATSEVSWRALDLVLEATGTLRYDETRVLRVGAGFAGRVGSIASSVDGAPVARGAPLLRVTSAEVKSSLDAYVAAAKQLKDAESRGAAAMTERLREQTDTLRKQLFAWGFGAEQLALLEESGVGEDVPLLAPFDGVVLHCEVSVGQQVLVGTPLVHFADPAALVAVLQVPRADAAWLSEGLPATIVDPVLPDVASEGRILQVAPQVDERTQTVAVRVAVESPKGLRPGAFVRARVRVPLAAIEPWKSAPRPAGKPHTVYECPMHKLVQETPGVCTQCGGMKLIAREITGGAKADEILAVPEGAVIDTGRAKLVYVEKAPGVFEPREVVVGPRAGAFHPVIRGLEAGERVVCAGAFLVDAESRLDPAAAATYFGASDAPQGGKDRR
jgi:membrane fusion protein, copper/silver efflux system